MLAAEVGVVSGQGAQGHLARPAELAASGSAPWDAAGRAGSAGGTRDGTWLRDRSPEAMAAVLAASGEAAPATAQAVPMGAAFGCLGRDAGTAVQLAWHPFRSKKNVQVWEEVPGMVVAQLPCPCF